MKFASAEIIFYVWILWFDTQDKHVWFEQLKKKKKTVINIALFVFAACEHAHWTFPRANSDLMETLNYNMGVNQIIYTVKFSIFTAIFMIFSIDTIFMLFI